MQFAFTNGEKTPLLEAKIKPLPPASLTTLPIDTTREIKYFSFYVVFGYQYNGIRIYDKNQKVMVDTGVWGGIPPD